MDRRPFKAREGTRSKALRLRYKVFSTSPTLQFKGTRSHACLTAFLRRKTGLGLPNATIRDGSGGPIR